MITWRKKTIKEVVKVHETAEPIRVLGEFWNETLYGTLDTPFLPSP